MEQRRLGIQGLVVSELGLGCMGMSDFYGSPDDDDSLRALMAAYDLGYRHFDTADIYGRGSNERLLGRFLAQLGPRRDTVFVATKVGIRRDPERPTVVEIDSSPGYLRAACEASLRRLGVERIDLLYLHRRNRNVPIEETMDALAAMVRAGKIARIGLSEVSVETLQRAARIAPVSALQSEYSLWSREVEELVLPACEALKIAFVAYSPLGRGFLSGGLSREALASVPGDLRNHLPRFQGENFDRNRALLATLSEVAAASASTPSQVALAWVLAQRSFVNVIPGTRQRAHLAANLAAGRLTLTDEQLRLLGRAFAPDAISGARYPNNLLASTDA